MNTTLAAFDNSSKPFTIGLKPLDLRDWIEIDGHLEAYLAEKDRLYATIPEKVFVAEDGTQDAQSEVLELLAAHLPHRFPDIFHVRSDARVTFPSGREIETTQAATQPLIAASRLVQEDLILMRRGPDGWRLAAGSLCFPSSWMLLEKFGKPLHEIHAPVPGFGQGTRMAELIERMFDKFAAGNPVYRFNWSIQSGDALYLPLSDGQRVERAELRPSKFPNGDISAHAFIRVERQTLRKLPRSGDVLFTIRIYLDPLDTLARQPDYKQLATAFAMQLTGLDASQLDYKGLTADRDRLVEMLNVMARQG